MPPVFRAFRAPGCSSRPRLRCHACRDPLDPDRRHRPGRPRAPHPGAAGAAAPSDALAETCRGADAADLASGTPTRTTLLRDRSELLESLTVIGVRLTYPNGARCDVLSVDGRLPFGHDVKRYAADLSELGTLVVAGADQGETEHQGIGTSVGGSPFREFDDVVLGAVVYAPTESGTMPALPGIPPEWQGQPYMFTHTRTTASLTLRLRKGVEKRFTVTPATRAAPRAGSSATWRSRARLRTDATPAGPTAWPSTAYAW